MQDVFGNDLHAKDIFKPGDIGNERRFFYLQEDSMDFWHGMIIGLFIGANTGVVITGLCKACKRRVDQATGPANWLHMDEAVLENAFVPVSKTPLPVITASSHPFPHS
jgi:hypothetical protein